MFRDIKIAIAIATNAWLLFAFASGWAARGKTPSEPQTIEQECALALVPYGKLMGARLNTFTHVNDSRSESQNSATISRGLRACFCDGCNSARLAYLSCNLNLDCLHSCCHQLGRVLDISL